MDNTRTNSSADGETVKERIMTCIVCPIGCELKVTYNDGKLLTVTGNTCKRGEMYARDEITDPRRTLTSTVKIISQTARLLPVKTSGPIPKDKLFEAMAILNKVTATAPIKVGDVLIKDFIEAGINLIAGKDIED